MLDLSHKKLEVYQLALKLLEEVYATTRQFPKEEMYVLTSQLRRAAISVCSNLAEGASRVSWREKKRFYEISRSSIVEIDTQFEIATVQKHLNKEQMKQISQYLLSVFRMLSKMIENLKERPTGHLPNPTIPGTNSI